MSTPLTEAKNSGRTSGLALAHGSAESAKDAIINMVQHWFASGGVVHMPEGGTIHASDVGVTVLVPQDDGSILGNLTFNALPNSGSQTQPPSPSQL